MADDFIIRDRSRQMLLIAISSVSVFISMLDYSMVNISLPSISSYFHVSVGSLQCGFRGAFIFGIIISALALLATLFAKDVKERTESYVKS